MSSIRHLLQNFQMEILDPIWLLFGRYGGEAASWASIRLCPQVGTGVACQGGAPPWIPPFALRAERQGDEANSHKRKEPVRSEVIKIRVTPEEKAELRRLAGRGSIADVFRAWLTGGEIPPQKVIKTADIRLLYHLNRIGNNLNQVAKGINRANRIGNAVDVAAVAARLKQIHSEIRGINAAQDSDGDDA